MTFDSARWRTERGNATGENVRSEMAGSLGGAGVVSGATRKAVRELLGPPDGDDPEGDLYFLGRSRTAPDYETLTIHYGPDGRVVAIEKRQS